MNEKCCFYLSLLWFYFSGVYLCAWILLSSNNLRHSRNAPIFPNTPESVIQEYEKVIEKVSHISNLYLILCAIIPSPATDSDSRPRFCKFNKLLKDVCQKNSQFCKYFNSPKFLCSNGKPNELLFEDGIHLNFNGTKFFCSQLAEFLMRLPKIWANYTNSI